MSIKKSIFLSDSSERIIHELSRDEESPQWSATINTLLPAAEWVFNQSLPDLSDGEWQTILNCYAGSCDYLSHPPYRIASDMMDDLGLLDVNQHPQSDLVRRVYEMTQAEPFAILYFVQRYWSENWNDAESFADVRDKIANPIAH